MYESTAVRTCCRPSRDQHWQILRITQAAFSYKDKRNCKYLTGSQHQICSFSGVFLPTCIHTVGCWPWLSKQPQENGSVYPKERLWARILQLGPNWLHLSSKKADKRKEKCGRGMDFSKNSVHESNSLQFTIENIALLPCQELWICKILLVFRQDQLLMSCGHQCSIDLSFCTEQPTKGQPSTEQLFTCKSGAVL